MTHAGPHTSSVPTRLFEALRNERRFDIEYRDGRKDREQLTRIPNYKVLKQTGLLHRLGVLYEPFVYAARVAIPLIALGQFFYALIVAALDRGRHTGGDVHIFATADTNVPVIRSAISHLTGRATADDIPNALGLRALAGRCGVRGVIAALESWVHLYSLILRSARDERMDLLLHARDACLLSLLAHHAVASPRDRFFTDAHYGRQAYLLSHLSARLTIVQHGYTDGRIPFEHPFGHLECLYVCDESFVEAFERYFKIDEWRILSFHRTLTANPYSDRGVFLASSFPSIDEEIELLSRLARTGVEIIVKLHPNHIYDARQKRLLGLASHVCRSDEYPACRVFVSYASFLEYEYRMAGVATYSIARSSVETVAEGIVERCAYRSAR